MGHQTSNQESNVKDTRAKLVIPVDIYRDMMLWCEVAAGEISGLGMITPENNLKYGRHFMVRRLNIFKQTCSGGGTHLDPDSINAFLYEFAQSDAALNGEISANFWWHTHADFNVFWSGTDKNTIDNTLSMFETPYFVSMVQNKKGEAYGRVDMYKPVRFSKPLEIVIELGWSSDHPRFKELVQEYREKVTYDRLPSYHLTGAGQAQIPGGTYINWQRTHRSGAELDEILSKNQIVPAGEDLHSYMEKARSSEEELIDLSDVDTPSTDDSVDAEIFIEYDENGNEIYVDRDGNEIDIEDIEFQDEEKSESLTKDPPELPSGHNMPSGITGPPPSDNGKKNEAGERKTEEAEESSDNKASGTENILNIRDRHHKPGAGFFGFIGRS